MLKSNRTTNVATVAGQANAPVHTVSQPSAFTVEEKLNEVPFKEVDVKSVAKDEGEWYNFSEDEILRDASLVARPIMTDESYKIKPKDPHYAFRWVEFKAHDGYYYNKALAFGFINCTPEDLLAHRGTVKENKIFNGDTMLMKIPKNIYGGMIKSNLLKSNAAITNKGAIKKAIAHAGPVVTTGRQPTMERDKAEFFMPSSADLAIKDRENREVGNVMDTSGKADAVFESL